MLALASTISMACAQSPKPLSDAQAIQSSEAFAPEACRDLTRDSFFLGWPTKELYPSPEDTPFF